MFYRAVEGRHDALGVEPSSAVPDAGSSQAGEGRDSYKHKAALVVYVGSLLTLDNVLPPQVLENSKKEDNGVARQKTEPATTRLYFTIIITITSINSLFMS